MTKSSVTVRLTNEQIKWIKSTNQSASDAIRNAIDSAIREQSYQSAATTLEKIPLDTQDDWGNPEDFMLKANQNEG